MNAWSTLFAAILSAAATLTGLIFVGVSISLTKVLSIPMMPKRASESLILLMTVLVTSTLCLVPGQPYFLMGGELLCIGIIVWSVTLRMDLRMLRQTELVYRRHYVQNVTFTQLAVLPYIISGILLLTQGGVGIYYLIPGIVFSFIKAVVDAWILLVEIHR